MIDFDKLNAMVDEVNNVISDVDKDTKQTNKEIDNLKETIWCYAHRSLAKMYKAYYKAIQDVDSNLKRDLEIRIDIRNGLIVFESGGITLKAMYDYYCIGDDYAPQRYKNYNKSHPTIIWFHNVASDWDDIIDDIEEQFVNGIHTILKKKSKIAHEKNVKAHESLNSISNSI